MIIIDNKAMCSGCTACAMICPQKCIEMVNDPMGFAYPSVTADKCVNCGLCEAICPNLADERRSHNDIPEAYAAVGKDDGIRQKSSSGGIFSLISKYVLSQGGVIFGAAFDPTFHSVRHMAIETEEDLKWLRGSKYAQSYMGHTYADVRSYLEQKRMVLFTGTPCQIVGLKFYLRKEYEHLYLLDIVCHGVPAPAVWDKYLEHLETRFKGKAVAVSFRDKAAGWRNYHVSVKFDNGRKYTTPHSQDPYMRGFLGNYYLRPSCYHCSCKGSSRLSDVTLGDLWGVERIIPEMDDDKGTSLIVISSSKGRSLFEKSAANMVCSPIILSEVVMFNSAIVRSAKEHPNSKMFEKSFQTQKIHHLLNKFCARPLHKRMVQKLRRILTRNR